MRPTLILRIVSGRIGPGRHDSVTAAYASSYHPIAMRTPGLDGFVVGTRPVAKGHGIAAMTLWSTVEAALAAYAGDLTATVTLDGTGHGEKMTDVDYYEVEDAVVRHEGVEASFLRLTAGTVARGLDADIQQELRRRLPELPGELAEGYVGRRVLGDVVEIAFVSTWSAERDRALLEAPIWPTISERYDTFRVGVFDIVLQGAPARS
jgi:hypothetical protein